MDDARADGQQQQQGHPASFSQPGGVHPSQPVVLPPQVVLLAFVFIIGLQFLVQFWKRVNPKSFNIVTLFLMWLFPGIICFTALDIFWRFAIFWAGYTLVTCFLFYLASRPVLAENTPRKVYAWFFKVYSLTHFLTIIGGFLFAVQLVGVFKMLPFLVSVMDTLFIPAPQVILFYGLYFGVMVRDCAELCADRMTNNLAAQRNKYYESQTLLDNNCGICGKDLVDRSNAQMSEEGGYRTMSSFTMQRMGLAPDMKTLPCKHNFHEFCIRGWVIVGKKDVCPVCREKVDLKETLLGNPWESDSPLYIQLLDMTRHFIAWNPLIIVTMFFAIQLLIRIFSPTAAQ